MSPFRLLAAARCTAPASRKPHSFIMLACRIRGKEEQINQYEEEAVVFKEKNYHHKERVKPRDVCIFYVSLHLCVCVHV